MDDSNVRFLIFVVAAAATVIASLITTYVARAAAIKERRRALYGEAIQAAVSWNELLYRVRKRRDNKEHAREITEKFHETQDRLAYYQGWVASESKYLARSYRRLIARIKTETEPLIQQAWSEPVRKTKDLAKSDGDTHSDVHKFVDAFVQDVRSHLSLLPWRKLAVAWRNRGSRGNPDERSSSDD